MKNTLRKTLLICFGFAFLGSLYSFKVLAKEDSKITKEVIIESDLCDCNYHLYVETCTGMWYLKLKNDCPDPIVATCHYTIYYEDGTHKKYTEDIRLNGYWVTVVASGYLDHSSCTADNVTARFAD